MTSHHETFGDDRFESILVASTEEWTLDELTNSVVNSLTSSILAGMINVTLIEIYGPSFVHHYLLYKRRRCSQLTGELKHMGKNTVL